MKKYRIFCRFQNAQVLKNYVCFFALQRFMIIEENSERKFIIEHLPSTFGYYFINFVVKHRHISRYSEELFML